MKKPSTIKKPKLVSAVKRPFKRAKDTETKVAEALQGVPRITNETVADHREEVLSAARKYIYPLQHSKHRIVRVSLIIFLSALIAFFAYCGLALYRYQSTSTFMYGVTRVVPFPVAKVGKSWVSYENYLFELRRNMHYHQVQQKATFNGKDGQAQLDHLKQQAMDAVILQAYVKQLAEPNHVTVSRQTVTNQVNLVRSQNRLGNNDRVFRDVLNQFWGWSIDDFRRELKSQLLQQAVVAKLDTATNARAALVHAQLNSGGDFAALAKSSSDDAATKENGGSYPNAITLSDRSVPAAVISAIFRLKANEVSPIINTGYALEIIKVADIQTSKVAGVNVGSAHAAHIQFNFKPIEDYVKPLAAKQKTTYYIKFDK